MDPGNLLRQVRDSSGLTLRELAARSGTSHSALAAYEHGRVAPGSHTLERILRAAGHELAPVPIRAPEDLTGRGTELWQVLELAAMFPARHDGALAYPRFADP